MTHAELDAIEARAKAARGSGLLRETLASQADIPALVAEVRALRASLERAEKVVEAVRARPWITRHMGDKAEDDVDDPPDDMHCEVCGAEWPDPEQVTNAEEYPETHADSCETVAINAALSSYDAGKGAP